MGEAKIVGDGVIFNITPSPGASTCLKNAMKDVHTLVDFFDGEIEFDETAFRAATIGNFPRADGAAAGSVGDAAADEADAAAADD